MSQSDSNKNVPSKMKQLLNGGDSKSDSNESPLERLQKSMGGKGALKKSPSSPKQQQPAPVNSTPASVAKPKPQPKKESKGDAGGYKFLPAFWTIASVMSFTVNVVLLLVAVVLLQNLNAVGVTVLGLSDHLLGGLYNNFVLMDQAHIKTTIPVSKEIPVQFTLNVSGPTNVTLSENVTISGARVTVNTGGLNINNALANIVLPRGTVLPITIENLVVPVDQKVLAELNVGVDIPLEQTELHAPFLGLRQVVEPFYCLLKKEVFVNNVNVCP